MVYDRDHVEVEAVRMNSDLVGEMSRRAGAGHKPARSRRDGVRARIRSPESRVRAARERIRIYKFKDTSVFL